jgi:hypothetical protein
MGGRSSAYQKAKANIFPYIPVIVQQRHADFDRIWTRVQQ